jgi:hypothetical protein
VSKPEDLKKFGERGRTVVSSTPNLPIKGGQVGTTTNSGSRVPPKGGSGTAPPSNQKK